MRVDLPSRLIVAAAALAFVLPLGAQQTSGDFRWMDFHDAKDQNIVAWITRSLAVEKWTAIREIGLVYDAALVVTADRPSPQSPPGDDSFTIWNVSLTSHVVAPLITGVNLRWFDLEHFADGAPEDLTILYDNCHDCAASSYFTALHYDIRAPHVGGALGARRSGSSRLECRRAERRERHRLDAGLRRDGRTRRPRISGHLEPLRIRQAEAAQQHAVPLRCRSANRAWSAR